jgi:hypothetical protein
MSELWNSGEESEWDMALGCYWRCFKEGSQQQMLERKLAAPQADRARTMAPIESYEFLRSEYFPWKFTICGYLKQNVHHLESQYKEDQGRSLHAIRSRILAAGDADNIHDALQAADDIGGLAPVGASGLIAVLFPCRFATVDQYVVKSLRCAGVGDAAAIDPAAIGHRDAVRIIEIQRRKAAELNEHFTKKEWTPRKIDMVLWAYRDGECCRCATSPGHTPDSAP